MLRWILAMAFSFRSVGGRGRPVSSQRLCTNVPGRDLSTECHAQVITASQFFLLDVVDHGRLDAHPREACGSDPSNQLTPPHPGIDESCPHPTATCHLGGPGKNTHQSILGKSTSHAWNFSLMHKHTHTTTTTTTIFIER